MLKLDSIGASSWVCAIYIGFFKFGKGGISQERLCFIAKRQYLISSNCKPQAVTVELEVYQVIRESKTSFFSY